MRILFQDVHICSLKYAVHFVVGLLVFNQVPNVGLLRRFLICQNNFRHLAWLVIKLWVKDVDKKPLDRGWD